MKHKTLWLVIGILIIGLVGAYSGEIWTGNLFADNANVTGDINANEFLGNINHSYITNEPNYANLDTPNNFTNNVTVSGTLLQSNTAYASLNYDDIPYLHPNSIEVVAGTILSGDLGSLNLTDDDFFTVDEDAKFDIQFNYTGLTAHPVKLKFHGRYLGSTSHDVWLYQWDFVGGTWNRTTEYASQDFVHEPDNITATINFNLLRADNYISGGKAMFRIYHSSNAVGSHKFYIDEIEILQESVALPNATQKVQLANMYETACKNIITNATAGTMEIVIAGDYKHLSTISFSGSNNEDVRLDLVINGVKLVTLWERMLNSNGDIGLASSTAIRPLEVGDIVTWEMSSDTANSFVSIIAMRNTLVRMAD